MKNGFPLFRLALRVALVIVLLALVLAPVAFAQDGSGVTELPANLTDLLAPGGLGVVVTILVGLLKRLNSQSAPGILGRFGDWLNASPFNQLVVSLLSALGVIAVVQLILYLGFGNTAQDVWFYFGVAWLTSQGLYNGQKVVANQVKTHFV